MTNDAKLTGNATQPDAPAWKKIVARYQNPSFPRGLWQIVNTVIPYAALWYLMYLTVAISWWLTLLLHRFPDETPFDEEMRRNQFDYLQSSEHAQASLAEQYVGLPFEE